MRLGLGSVVVVKWPVIVLCHRHLQFTVLRSLMCTRPGLGRTGCVTQAGIMLAVYDEDKTLNS